MEEQGQDMKEVGNEQGPDVSYSSSNSSNSKAGRKKKAFDEKKSRSDSRSFTPERKQQSRSRSRSPGIAEKANQEWGDHDEERDRRKERKHRDQNGSIDQRDFGGRQNDWDQNERQKGGYNDRHGRRDRGEDRRKQRIAFPSFDKPMYTRKDFENYQEGRFERHELNDEYNKYCKKHKEEQEYEFYREHRMEPWFIERYDPSEIYKWKQVQIDLSNYISQQFKKTVTEPLESEGKCPKIKLDQDPDFDYNMLQDEQGKDIQLHKEPLFAFDTDSLTLYLKYIPINIKRIELKQALEANLQGFVHLSMSEPMRNHGFTRLAWVNFSNEHDCEQALAKIPTITIGDFTLSAAKSHPNKKRTPVRITPPLPAKMIQHDYELCKRLISEVFDPEKNIETYVISAVENFQKPEAGENDEEQKAELSDQIKLDLLLLYLRRVHAFCLYCSEEYEDERMLSTRCGPQHIRNHQQISEEEFSEIVQKNQASNSQEAQAKNEKETAEPNPEGQNSEFDEEMKVIRKLGQESSTKWGGSMIFLSKYVKSALKKIADGPRKLVDPEQEFINQDKEDFFRYKCKEVIPNERYSCEVCKKVFKGEDFVIKHIKNKHQDFIDETYERESTQNWLERNIQKKLKEEKKLNYQNDENKLFNQPGRKYHESETSYFAGSRERGGHRGGRGGARGGRVGFNSKGFNDRTHNYIDYDDPNVNRKLQADKKDGRELVDYSDLFG